MKLRRRPTNVHDIATDLVIRLVILLAKYPRRLTVEQAAHVLGFQVGDMAVLHACGLLKPIGKPEANAQKWYATEELMNLDAAWISAATRAVYTKHRLRNGKTKKHKQEAA